MFIRAPLLLTLTSMSSAVAGTIAVMGQERDDRIRLPSPRMTGNVSVEEALQQRRSVREFARRALSLSEISQILWAVQGETNREGYRTAPSAGAMFPLEVYLVVGAVEDLAPGVYRYSPSGHEVERMVREDVRAALATASVGQRWMARAPASVVIAAVYERTAQRYGARGPRYVHIEVGHAAQNVYLQAGALGLATVFVGAFRDDEVRQVLGLPVDHAPLGVMPLGHPR